MNDKIDNIELAHEAKSNGQPYALLFDEEYDKMNSEERAEVDRMMVVLAELIGTDEEDFEENETT